MILEKHTANKLLLINQDVRMLPLDPPMIRRSGFVYPAGKGDGLRGELMAFLQERIPKQI